MTKQQYEKRKKDLEQKIRDAKTTEELDTLEVEKRKLEMMEIVEDSEITPQEERNLIRGNDDINIEERNLVRVNVSPEEKKEKRKTLNDILKTPEYRSAWAKKLMGIKLESEEERALGDAVTTTDTTFTQSTSSEQGINNGGLFIPVDVRLDMLKIIEQTSPFLRDVRKLAVASNVDLPYLNSSDDAEWYAELENTKNEGQKYDKISLTGHELAKQIEVTWKLEAMAVEEFITFITTELAHKMGKALAKAVLYGDGNKKPIGALHGLTAVSGTEAIEAMINAYSSLSDDAKIDAKAYISNTVAISIVGYKDKNGNYPYLLGLNKIALFSIEVDPYLTAGDILTGNPKNYILNTVEALKVYRETKISQRRNVYSNYAVYDGKPYPDSFAKGEIVPGA